MKRLKTSIEPSRADTMEHHNPEDKPGTLNSLLRAYRSQKIVGFLSGFSISEDEKKSLIDKQRSDLWRQIQT